MNNTKNNNDIVHYNTFPKSAKSHVIKPQNKCFLLFFCFCFFDRAKKCKLHYTLEKCSSARRGCTSDMGRHKSGGRCTGGLHLTTGCLIRRRWLDGGSLRRTIVAHNSHPTINLFLCHLSLLGP